jgi:MFS family permease
MRDVYQGWRVVIASFFVALYVGAAVFFGFTVFFEPMVTELGWSYTQFSFAITLRGMEMGILAPIVGFLINRLGSRKLILYGTTAVGLGLILLGLTRSLTMFYTSILLIAFGAGGCTNVVLMTAVSSWFKRNAGKAIGVMACGFGLSGLLIPLIVELIERYQWRATLIIMGLGMWVLGVPLSFVIRERPESAGALPAREEMAEPDSGESSMSKVPRDFGSAIRNRDFWCINIGEAMRMSAVMAVVTHVMPYLSSIGVPRQSAGLVAGAIPVASVIGRFGFGWLADLFEKKHVLAWAYLCMGVGMLSFSYARFSWFIVLFLLLFPPGFGGIMTLRAAILREYFGMLHLGRLLGITMGTASIGGMIGAPVAGWFFDMWGSYHLIWHAFCGLIGLGLIIILMIRPRRRTV